MLEEDVDCPVDDIIVDTKIEENELFAERCFLSEGTDGRREENKCSGNGVVYLEAERNKAVHDTVTYCRNVPTRQILVIELTSTDAVSITNKLSVAQTSLSRPLTAQKDYQEKKITVTTIVPY